MEMMAKRYIIEISDNNPYSFSVTTEPEGCSLDPLVYVLEMLRGAGIVARLMPSLVEAQRRRNAETEGKLIAYATEAEMAGKSEEAEMFRFLAKSFEIMGTG